ncbi:MAG TPA: radical SAM protein [Desulfatiglandales bacterium]|nr:radical SAM protein [Desulfatiglandales bacterium]
MVSLSSFKSIKKPFRRYLNSRKVKPTDSILYITYRCTSRCSTCNIWKWTKGRLKESKNSEISLNEWNQVVENLYDNGIRSIELFGGDALLRKDVVYSIIKKCSKLGIETYFPTNSNLLDKETANNLVLGNLGTIYFSVDGVDELHDNIRGIDRSYERFEDAIFNVYNLRSKYHKKRPQIIGLTTVSNMNADNIEFLISEFKNLPFDFIYLRALGEISQEDIKHSSIEGIMAKPPFMSTSGQSHLLSKEQAMNLSKSIKRLRSKRSELPFYLTLSHLESFDTDTYTKGVFPLFPCNLCRTVITMTPYGEVVPCPMFSDFILGNLLEEDLCRIWGNDKHRKFLAKQCNGEFAICRKCNMSHFYPGPTETFHQIFYPYLHPSKYS